MLLLRKVLYIAIIGLTGLLLFQILSRAKGESNELAYDIYQDQEAFFHDEAFDSYQFDTFLIAETYAAIKVPLYTIKPSNSIFIRYSATGCAQCIENLMGELENLREINDSIKIIILMKNIGNRDLYVNWKSFDEKFEMLKLNYLPLDTINSPDIPYLFRMNADGTMRDHFICQFGDQKYLKKYLNSL